MRSLWMSSCEVTFGACKTLAEKMPRLNVEIINEGEQIEASPDDIESKRFSSSLWFKLVVDSRQCIPMLSLPIGKLWDEEIGGLHG
ncbi:protein AUXIN SIGNALING F-BOX 3 [Sesamum angolense]|uniref:Protein AUXIN SIGNALING F-BOX 3 n=1 Tax=Sesamum angolense TaxID=2727404 RepID=A0AAE1WG32_9LAMI|nr:protein AUXIN SIGNALING F-BOX 3 [Sesamum angolense]